jgi:hypothetical protein
MLIITKKMIQEIECPKCKAKKGESCGHRKDKSRSHFKRLQAAQKYYRRKVSDPT